MKLIEFFQQQYPDRTIDDVKNDPDVGPILTKKTVAGDTEESSGAFASAYADKTDPTSVIKIGKTESGGTANPKKDGYLNYITRIKNLKLPVFPQIHSVEIFEHKGQGGMSYYCFKVKMERLYNAGDLNTKEVHYLIQRLIGRELTEEESKKIENYGSKLIWFYSSMLQHLASEGTTKGPWDMTHNIDVKLKDIHDRYLLTAITAIRSIAKVKKVGLDLHAGNIMFRRTPYGIQPVITDPLA